MKTLATLAAAFTLASLNTLTAAAQPFNDRSAELITSPFLTAAPIGRHNTATYNARYGSVQAQAPRRVVMTGGGSFNDRNGQAAIPEWLPGGRPFVDENGRCTLVDPMGFNNQETTHRVCIDAGAVTALPVMAFPPPLVR